VGRFDFFEKPVDFEELTDTFDPKVSIGVCVDGFVTTTSTSLVWSAGRAKYHEP
jgi:hypothetical protein